MNNLTDISMNKDFSTMFGYTQSELEYYFSDYIDDGIKATGMSREDYLSKLKEQYDGYMFNEEGENVYNPVSIGNFFSRGGKEFKNYWVSTGNSKLIMDIAKKVDFSVVTDTGKDISVNSISNFDVLNLREKNINKNDLISLLLQSGYMLIKENLKEMPGSTFQTKKYPKALL